jgi:disulfide oxidoreductase YuzD
MDIETWCQLIEKDFYREHGYKIVYLQNARKHFNRWLSKQWAFPDHSKRQEMFYKFVEIENGVTSQENIREGLKKYFNKPWYQRVYEALTHKSS